MRLSIYDPQPPANEYLTRMFLGPLRSYCSDQGIETEIIDNPDTVSGKIVLIAGDHMSHDRIGRIKEHNKLVVFDINDSSYISATYSASDRIPDIDLIFKISGVPNRNLTVEPGIDANFKITTHEVKYLPDDEWEKFQTVRHKIKPLPYTLWSPLVQPNFQVLSQDQRNGKVLVGGGNHFWRVILFFKLVQRGMSDLASQFSTDAYFADDMVPQFRYCEACRSERKALGKTPYNSSHDPSKCTSPGKWGDPLNIVGSPGFGQVFGHFNNSCPAAFFWWSKQYENHSGPLNEQIEKALNGRFRPSWDFVQDLSKTSFYADYKPLNTIYVPPRFWEAASIGTPSLYPQRTAHQDYWPPMVEDEHYYTYDEDMGDFALDPANMPPKHWEHVSKSVKALYEDKIRETQYPISNSLLEYMVLNITEASS